MFVMTVSRMRVRWEVVTSLLQVPWNGERGRQGLHNIYLSNHKSPHPGNLQIRAHLLSTVAAVLLVHRGRNTAEGYDDERSL